MYIMIIAEEGLDPQAMFEADYDINVQWFDTEHELIQRIVEIKDMVNDISCLYPFKIDKSGPTFLGKPSEIYT